MHQPPSLVNKPGLRLSIIVLGHLLLLIIGVYFIFQIKEAKLSLLDEARTPQEERLYFHDLNNDGVIEEVRLKNYYGTVSTIHINSSNRFMSEIKVDGLWMKTQPLHVHDLDQDGTSELLAFTVRNDSLILSICDLHKAVNQFPIFQLSTKYSYSDYNVTVGGVYNNHFYFSVTAGYSLTPRAVYSVNLADGNLKRTKEGGAVIKDPYFFDLDLDGRHEIVTRSFAPENIHHEVAYTDSSAWLMVFDKDLNLSFPPRRFTRNKGEIMVHPVRTDSGNFLAVSYYSAKVSNTGNSISLINKNGQVVVEKSNDSIQILFQLNDALYAIDNDKAIYRVDNQLKKLHLQLQNIVWPNSKILMGNFFDGDEEDEMAYTQGHSLFVFNKDLSSKYSYQFSNPVLSLDSTAGTLYVNTKPASYRLTMKKNQWYGLRIPLAICTIILTILSGRWMVGLHRKARSLKVNTTALSRDFVIFNSMKETFKVSYSDIFYLEADGKYTKVYTTDHSPLTSYKNLGEIRSDLPENLFMRTHRSVIVNKQRIKGINKIARMVILATDDKDVLVRVSKKNISLVEHWLSRS